MLKLTESNLAEVNERFKGGTLSAHESFCDGQSVDHISHRGEITELSQLRTGGREEFWVLYKDEKGKEDRVRIPNAGFPDVGEHHITFSSLTPPSDEVTLFDRGVQFTRRDPKK